MCASTNRERFESPRKSLIDSLFNLSVMLQSLSWTAEIVCARRLHRMLSMSELQYSSNNFDDDPIHCFTRSPGVVEIDVQVGKQQRLIARLVAPTVGLDGDKDSINLRQSFGIVEPQHPEIW